MRRERVAALFLACVLAAQFVSCGKSVESESSNTPDQDIYSDLPEPEKAYDLNGYTLNIAKIAQSNIAWVLVTFGTEEETGEVLNDAIVKRNRQTMEKNNFRMNKTEFESSAVPTIQKLVNAGDDEYQIGYIYSSQFADLHEKLVRKMISGKSDISSTIASCRDAVDAGIKKYTGG